MEYRWGKLIQVAENQDLDGQMAQVTQMAQVVQVTQVAQMT